MPAPAIARILLIDDVELNNIISTYTIRKLEPDIEIVSFTEPVNGLAYIKKEYQHGNVPTLLLLDINMPVLNGWEVLEVLDACDAQLTANIHIYILSSSINPRDKQRAADVKKVSGFLERPLTVDMLRLAMG